MSSSSPASAPAPRAPHRARARGGTAPIAVRSREIRHGGYRYHYGVLDSPRRDYSPVLLVGGAFQSMRSLRRFAGCIAPRTRVVLVDLPGSGDADLLPAEVGADFLADCLQRVLARERITAVNVVGVSFGTAIAYELAQRHRSLVESMVLIGTMSHVDRHMCDALSTTRRALERGDAAAFSRLCSEVLLNHERRADIENFEFAEKLLHSATSRLGPTGARQFLENSRRLMVHRKLDLADPPECRTLIFTGEHDSLTTPERCREVARSMPNASFTTVERADHLLPLQRLARCAELVDGFFERAA